MLVRRGEGCVRCARTPSAKFLRTGLGNMQFRQLEIAKCALVVNGCCAADIADGNDFF